VVSLGSDSSENPNEGEKRLVGWRASRVIFGLAGGQTLGYEAMLLSQETTGA
jgi:hypothetical protein